jgi:phage gpG-like protein
VITVQIDQSALQMLKQQLSTLPPRLTAEVYKAIGPLVYQSLYEAVPKYFSGSGNNMLTSRSGNLLNSVLQSIQTNIDGEGLTVTIGSDLPYAAVHEYGGYAGRRGPFKKKDGRRPYLPPRPYLHPAMDDLQKALPGLVEQAIQQVQASQ